MDRHCDELGGADLAESGRHDPSGFDRTSGAILGPEDSRWPDLIRRRRVPLHYRVAPHSTLGRATCTAASYIGEIFIGHFLYNETITLIHLTAVAFIGCGVILLALAAK